VHAPSRGKRVERVSFDDRYWGPRIRKAGRIQITGTNIAMSS
jgi:hypothetical protein